MRRLSDAQAAALAAVSERADGVDAADEALTEAYAAARAAGCSVRQIAAAARRGRGAVSRRLEP